MAPKHPKDYSLDEVCLFLNAIGLGDKQDDFRANSVDGMMLVNLQPEDFRDLGMTNLQGKKVMRSVEFCAGLASGGGGGSDKDAEKIKALEQENAALKAEVASLKAKLNPPKANPAPAPAQAPPPQQYNHGPAHPVARHAAGGAAKGAVLGAVAGAIAGDPAQGAKMGAAVGATAGGMQGLGERRRARLARRF